MPVTSLDRYVFRQGLMSFLVSTAIVTAVVWVTQTLQRADIIVEHGRSLAVLARISLLILPSLLAVIIPFALFIAALYSIQRLHSDSEIAVMFASGVSRLRIGAPLLLIAGVGALATLVINTTLMPASYRVLKREIYEIRTDFASALLRSGEFTPFDPGFTIYIEDVRPASGKRDGVFIGLLVNDYRNPNETITYMAQRGVLRQTENGPVLALVNGNIQRLSPQTGVVEIVPFDETVV
ncbi:MAG: LptF/LptG family permease, partial [Parvularculaceae bacterium]